MTNRRHTIISLELRAPDLSSRECQQRALRELQRDLPWLLSHKWGLEYWGLRSTRRRVSGWASVRGAMFPPEGAPRPIQIAIAWLTHFLLSLRSRPNDVVVAWTPWMGVGAALAKRLGLLRAPLVVRVQGRTASRARFVRRSHRRAAIVDFADRFVLRTADLAVPMGLFTRKLAERAGLDPEHVVEVPFPPLWDPGGDEPPADDGFRGFRVVAAGRLEPEKGFDVLIRAFDVVRQRFPEAVLHIAGSGKEQPSLEALAASLGLEASVRFAGWLEPDGMRALMLRSSVVVLPSRVEEGLGMALVDGGLARCALIGSDLGGIRDMVIPDRTGIRVPPGQPKPLAGAISELFASPGRCLDLGQAAREHALAYVQTRPMALEALRERIQKLASP